MPRPSIWTEEEVAWLKRHFADGPRKVLAVRFEDEFGWQPKVTQLHTFGTRHKLRGAPPTTRLYLWKEEEAAWLRLHFTKWPRKELAARFEQKFGWRPKVTQLTAFCTRNKLQGAPRAGTFKKGHDAGRARPLWSERIDNHNGYPTLMIKVPGASSRPALRDRGWQQSGIWMRKAVWVWTQEHGPVPDGHVVMHLDGDQMNCAPDNLGCVSLPAQANLNHHSTPGFAGPEINPARIKVAELRAKVSELRKA